MNRNGDNSPSMDFDELRRRHEQFKMRQTRNEAGASPQTVPRSEIKPQPKPIEPAEESAKELPNPAPVPEEAPEVPFEAPASDPSPAEDAPSFSDRLFQEADPAEDAAAPEPIDAVPEDSSESESLSEAPDASDEGEDFDEYGDEEANRDENPFNSMISIFRGVWNKVSAHKAKKAWEEDEPDGEEDISDEDGESEIPDEDFDGEDEAPVKMRKGLFSWRKKRAEEEEETLDYDDSDYAAEDYVAEAFPPQEDSDAPQDVPDEDYERPSAPPAESEDVIEDIFDTPADTPAEYVSDDGDFTENDDPDEDDDAEDDGGSPERVSGFKRFLNLFIVREDNEDEEKDGGEDWDEDGWEANPNPSIDFIAEPEPEDASPWSRPRAGESTPGLKDAQFSRYANAADFEGGSDMDEKNKINIDMTELMADGLESRGMTRRERRELAERQAAQEAAKRAAEEAAAQKAKRAEEEAAAQEAKRAEEEAAKRDLSDLFDGAKALDEEAKETPAEEPVSDTDEPTRIFKPLSGLSASQPVQDSVFDLDEDDEEDDEDDEDETEKKRGHFSFFRKKHEEDEEDEDDDEDEEEDDYDDDEDDEEAKKSRRSLFGRKSRSVKYDEDEEDDEDDEDEDEDDYDEYDEYDDEDEEDEDDYDDDGRPLGMHIVGFFKCLLGFVLIVLILVFALNFLDYFNVFSLDSVFEHHYNKAPGVFDTLFPSHKLKADRPQDEGIAAVATPTPEPAATDAPDAAPTATLSLSTATDAPAVTETPAPTDVPAVG